MNRSLALAPLAFAGLVRLGGCAPDPSQYGNLCKTWKSYAVMGIEDSRGCAYVESLPMPGMPGARDWVLHVADKKQNGKAFAVAVTSPTGFVEQVVTSDQFTRRTRNNAQPRALRIVAG